jgi:hypothetical protein
LFGCYLCCFVYCLCVNVYCHRVTTQLQLINILLLTSPWSQVVLEDSNWSRSSQHFVIYPDVCYRVHNSPPLLPIPNDVDPVHSFPHCFFNIHFNIVLRLPVFSAGFPTKCCLRSSLFWNVTQRGLVALVVLGQPIGPIFRFGHFILLVLLVTWRCN